MNCPVLHMDRMPHTPEGVDVQHIYVSEMVLLWAGGIIDHTEPQLYFHMVRFEAVLKESLAEARIEPTGASVAHVITHQYALPLPYYHKQVAHIMNRLLLPCLQKLHF